jgi:hypothetical protein
MSFKKDKDASEWQAEATKQQPPIGYNNSWPNAETGSYSWNASEDLYRKAAARVKAKIRLYRYLFIYILVTTASWIFAAGAVASNRFAIQSTKADWIIPIFITVIGGLLVGWKFFKVFVLGSKDYQEMLEEEVRKLRNF